MYQLFEDCVCHCFDASDKNRVFVWNFVCISSTNQFNEQRFLNYCIWIWHHILGTTRFILSKLEKFYHSITASCIEMWRKRKNNNYISERSGVNKRLHLTEVDIIWSISETTISLLRPCICKHYIVHLSYFLIDFSLLLLLLLYAFNAHWVFLLSLIFYVHHIRCMCMCAAHKLPLCKLMHLIQSYVSFYFNALKQTALCRRLYLFVHWKLDRQRVKQVDVRPFFPPSGHRYFFLIHFICECKRTRESKFQIKCDWNRAWESAFFTISKVKKNNNDQMASCECAAIEQENAESSKLVK